MKRSLLLLFTIIPLFAYVVEPSYGSYLQFGKVYQNGKLAKNKKLEFVNYENTINTTTNNLGEYEVELTWRTMDTGLTIGMSKENIEIKNEQINPDLKVMCEGKTISIKSFWKEEQTKQKNRELNLKF